jgi:hypothetical protein
LTRAAAASRAVRVAALAGALPGVAVRAQGSGREIVAELFGGTAWSLPLPVDVRTHGESVRFAARWSTRPLADAPYYAYRVSSGRRDGSAIELEMLHHKLYLENPRAPVERFEVTHGYNLPTVNFARPAGGWRWRVGVGLVVAHPEGRIAGRDVAGARTRLRGGYHVAGVTTQLAGGRRWALVGGRTALVASPEAKLTASWARLRLDGSTVTVPNVALHLLGGLGVRWRSRE